MNASKLEAMLSQSKKSSSISNMDRARHIKELTDRLASQHPDLSRDEAEERVRDMLKWL